MNHDLLSTRGLLAHLRRQVHFGANLCPTILSEPATHRQNSVRFWKGHRSGLPRRKLASSNENVSIGPARTGGQATTGRGSCGTGFSGLIAPPGRNRRSKPASTCSSTGSMHATCLARMIQSHSGSSFFQPAA